MSKLRAVLIPLCVVLGIVAIVGWAARNPIRSAAEAGIAANPADVKHVVAQVDEYISKSWADKTVSPAPPADDLIVLRRLSLALHGTIPSLEEIRAFEADTDERRMERWVARMLADNRFADNFAERLARCYVGTEMGQFIVFRRDRFTAWLREQLRSNRPYDEMTRQMISEQGLWTDSPASNFTTAAVVEEDVDENKLAGRVVRTFLGQRMDCAQCHDHPFADWKQSQYEGLAAHFGQVRPTIAGVEDKTFADGKPVEYQVEDRVTLEMRTVAPAVPFHPEWMPEEGTRRARLAAWVTHPQNVRFERATANRVWGLLFGRAYIEPVDDLKDPDEDGQPDLLDILGTDFREHGYDLKRLIQVVALSRPFRIESSQESFDDPDAMPKQVAAWAAYPLVRLRPEQVVGSILQAGSIKTIDQNSHLFVRFLRYIRENEFVQEYGDLGEDELSQHVGTIPQALMRMNGKLPNEIVDANFFSASGRIADYATDDETCLETCYLVCLSRRPTAEEKEYFLPQLKGTEGDARKAVVEDLYWSLYNSEEFSWAH